MRRCDVGWILPLLALLWSSPATATLRVDVYTTQNGLPHNRINALYTDSRGFLWICTDDGLARFDGQRFTNYTTADGLPHIHVNGVLETRAGEYWIATDGGITRFDPRPGRTRFTTYVPPGPAEARYINGMAEEPDGTLALATNAGLFWFRASQRVPIFERVDLEEPADLPAATKVHRAAHDDRGRLWLATEGGLVQRRANGWTFYGRANGLPDDFVTSLTTDREGRLWAGFTGGFGRIASDPGPAAPIFDLVRSDDTGRLGRQVRALWFGRDGRRWIGTDVGLREWLADAKGVSQFVEHPTDGVPDGVVLSLCEDAAGNLWIGTRRNGLVRAAPSEFFMFGPADGLRLGRDQTLIPTQSGDVALFDIGDRRKQVYIHDRGRFIVTRPALPPAVGAIPHWLHTAKQDHTGAWWFSTESGVFRFPTLDGRFDLHLLANDHADRFFEDTAGDVWISNWGPGVGARLSRWERSSGRLIDETDRLPRSARLAGIAALAQDAAGGIWIGLQRPGGVYRLRHGAFEAASVDIGGHINNLFVDSGGRLWIASTENGLGLIERPQAVQPSLRRFGRAHGLSGEEVWCVTEDGLGRIYAGTAHGVDRLDPATGQIVRYSSVDGLVRGDIRSALRDRGGDLWFVSANGVSRFTPREHRVLPPSTARITGIRVGGVLRQLSEFGEPTVGPLQFRSHENSVQVDFAVIDFPVRAPLRYQFRLARDGAGKAGDAWQDAGKDASVHLASLAPGHYSLSVRAMAPDQVAGRPAVLMFAIQPPWWRTWWFQAASGVTLAMAAYAVHRHRLRNHLALERMRSHIAMDLHDDIGASLSRISVICEVIRGRLPSGDDQIHHLLTGVAASSRALVKDMGDIVWSLDPRHDQVGELASRLRAFGSDLLERRGIEWSVEAPDAELRQTVPPDVRRQVYLVLKEGIHNIGKHAHATTASLRLEVRNGRVRGELTDDGRGIAGRPNGGNGVASMRARVSHLDGSIDISGTPAGGTRVYIDVPLANTARSSRRP
ncbi:MAG TPA: two-component regulator propeller domain-containing protein [Vicinamibacterales bacterium]|nr:two-component regulator propeller domain-containing protein [Vicinamibacterales bacterium]